MDDSQLFPNPVYGRVDDRAGVESCALGQLSPIGRVAAERMDRSGPSKELRRWAARRAG